MGKKIDNQKPFPQSCMTSMHDSSRRQRSLTPASMTLAYITSFDKLSVYPSQPHSGHIKPFGHRILKKCSLQSSSVLKRFIKSIKVISSCRVIFSFYLASNSFLIVLNLPRCYNSIVIFGNVLDILGIQAIRASPPQAKGCVERLWGTLQKRLPVDMRIAEIKSIEEANRFFSNYIKRHNEHFGVEAVEEKSAFLPGPPEELRRFIICVRETRKTGEDSSISWGRKK
jgi:hypothetical protein